MWLGSSSAHSGVTWRVVGVNRDAGEVVAIGIVGVVGIAVVARHLGVGLVLGDAVEVDDAVLQVDAVAGDADAAFHEVEVGRLGMGLEEDDDIAALDVAVADEGNQRVGGASVT